MNRTRAVPAALLGTGLVLVLAASSRIPWETWPSQDAELVLSWRGVADSNELCREPTAEDLAGLPSHMRPDRICEEQLSTFQLTVRIDGTSLIDRTVEPSGARGDRPLYVLDRFPVPPGPHRLEIGFVPVLRGEAVLPMEAPGSHGIRLDETVTFTSRHVVLVTRDGDRGEFVVRRADQSSEPVR